LIGLQNYRWVEMKLTIADQIWNRAALQEADGVRRTGDRALVSLLHVHGLIMNGGVHHAIESVNAPELAAAADGYAFFGLHDVTAFLRGAGDDPVLSKWTDDSEVTANRRYQEMIPSDSYLVLRFQEVLRLRPDEFAPIDHE
jgi:hypothetical protein